MTNKHNMRIIVWILLILSMLSLVSAIAGNNIVSEVREFTVNNLPIVRLVAPVNNTKWTSSFNINFRYNVSDAGDTLQNCSLYINDVWNASNESVIVQNQNLTINISLANGNYNWSVHCFDSYGSEGISETYNLTVEYLFLSINVVDALIDFGVCIPESGTGSWFDSNDTSKNGTGPGFCSGLSYPQNFTVENDGNMNANVTIQTDGLDLTGGTNPELWFATQNSTLRPGCFDGLKQSWVNFTDVDTEFVACEGLNSSDSYDRFWTFLRVFAPSDSEAGERNVTITFIAKAYD